MLKISQHFFRNISPPSSGLKSKSGKKVASNKHQAELTYWTGWNYIPKDRTLQFLDMFIVDKRTKFQLCSSVGSLIIAIKLKAKFRFHAATVLFFFFIFYKRLP
jgi:hypothetical protein